MRYSCKPETERPGGRSKSAGSATQCDPAHFKPWLGLVRVSSMVKVNKLGGELRPISLLPASNFVVVDFLYCLYTQSLHHGEITGKNQSRHFCRNH